MKQPLYACLIFIITVITALTAPTDAAAQERVVKYNTAVGQLSVSAGIKATFVPGTADVMEVKVRGPQEYLSKVSVVCTRQSLNISIDKTVKKPAERTAIAKSVRVVVEAPIFDTFAASASGEIDIVSPLSPSKAVSFRASSSAEIDVAQLASSAAVSVTATSSGQVELESLQCAGFSVQASSSADVKAKGATVQALDINGTSSAEIDFEGTAASLTVAASSSADVEVSATVRGKASVQATSASEVTLKGSATTLDALVTTGATVDARRFAYAPGSLRTATGGTIKKP